MNSTISTKTITIVVLFCFIVLALCGYGKELKLPKGYTFLVDVRDNLTRHPIDGAAVEVFVKNDSINTSFLSITQDGEVEIDAPTVVNKYFISISYQPMKRGNELWEYEKERVEYTVKDKYSKIQNVGTIYLKHKKHIELNEVSVNATKVMFYYKGDTLVYNADAFVLAKGSMLDGLISQMPGVKLKRNGEITVNGKKVDNLLLNGKDVFNGKRQLMLENLAAYTVRDIAVYNKAGFESEALGINAGSQYVMDVRLKRQFKHGFLGNLEAAYGTDNRYRAKLFGMWYSDNVGMTAFLSSNNLNDDAQPKPGYSDGSWNDLNPSTGTGAYHSGGITYNAEGPDRKWMMSGDAVSKYSDGTVLQSQSIDVLIPGNEMYQYNWNDSHKRLFSINTSHMFKATLAKRVVFTILPKLDYQRIKSDGSNSSAIFNSEIENISRSLLENIYTAENTSYSQSLLNRSLNSNYGHENRFLFSIDGSSLIKLNRNDGRSMLTLGVAANVENQNSDIYTYRQLRFQTVQESDYSILQRNNLSPYNNREYKGYAKFSQSLGFLNSSMNIDYNYTRKESTRTSLFYQDDIAQDFLIPSMLPQFSEALPLNPSESYRSNQWENNHSIKADFSMRINQSETSNWWYFYLGVPISVSQRNLNYRRGEYIQHIAKTSFLPNIETSIGFSSQEIEHRHYYPYVRFSSSVRQPQLMNMVDIIDNNNPMNLVLGNPALHNSRSNTVKLGLEIQGKSPHHFLNLSYKKIHNAISQGYYYLSNTGQSISRPYCVDGNFNVDASYVISWYRMDRYTVSNKIEGGYLSSRELIGSIMQDDADFDVNVAPPVNRVDNLSVSDRFDFSYNFSGKYNLKAFADFGVRKYRGFNTVISDDLVFNGSYGISGILNFPLNWGLNTDITLYTRRGYMDSRLNATEVLWNAKIQKSILKGSMIFSIEGYDLLRQLSNISYTVNAQYRTETVTNVIPAYFLLSIKYNFNKQPNRK